MPLPFPLSFPYPSTFHPSHYGPPTSNVNFCELDYQFTSYIAEPMNTISNLVYLIYALHGLLLLQADRRLTFSTSLPHLGLAAVGLGSASFHSTLLKRPQLADEIAMAIPTGAVASRLLTFQIRDPGKRSLAYRGALLTVTAVYVVHCLTFSNWLHYPALGTLVFYVGRRCVGLIRRIEDDKIRRKVRRQARLGRVLFLGAFGLWLIDRLCCSCLIRARYAVGLPWGWLLELHAWWHVGTGMGAFVLIQVADYLVEEDGGKKDPGGRLSPFEVRFWGHQRLVGSGGAEDVKGGRSVNGSVGGNVSVKERKKRM